MRKIVVTGANGFVGSHLVGELCAEGFEVVPLVRDGSASQFLCGVEPVAVDWGRGSIVSDLESLLLNAECVVHCAAAVMALSYEAYYNANVLTTQCLLEACVRARVRHFVLLSSQAVLGPSSAALNEEAPCKPISDYGKTKLLAEQLALKYAGQLTITVLRPCSVYGPRDAQFLALFQSLQKRLLLSPMYEQKFHLIYVLDLVSAIVACVNNASRACAVFYVTDGRVYTGSEVYSCVRKILGVKRVLSLRVPKLFFQLYAWVYTYVSKLRGRTVFLNTQKVRELIQKEWLCDSTKIQQTLAFRPSYTIEKGFLQTYQWYRKQGLVK